MADSSEYRRILNPELGAAFQRYKLSLAKDLLAVGLISKDDEAEIKELDESLGAAKLLELIRNKVKLDPTSYYTFMEVLKSDQQYKEILETSKMIIISLLSVSTKCLGLYKVILRAVCSFVRYSVGGRLASLTHASVLCAPYCKQYGSLYVHLQRVVA